MQRDPLPVTIAEIQKNGRETLRIDLAEFRGVNLVSLRVWYRAANGDMRPGKDGLALRVEQLPELVAALQRAEEEARALRLLPGGGAR